MVTTTTITNELLLQTIGLQKVENDLLRSQLAQLQKQIQDTKKSVAQETLPPLN